MIVTLVGIVNKGLTKKRISIDSWLMPLTVVSLIVQTQGFADFNVFTIPTFLLSVYFLFRTKRIFMVGLLFGITLSIKWQPVILLPLFCASFLNFETNILVGLGSTLIMLTSTWFEMDPARILFCQADTA